MLAEPPVIAIVGPTAIGKTAVAIELARLFDGRAQLISADSVQVYRGLDIGSAKPSQEEQRQVTIRLIDVADPDQNFTLSDYQNLAVDAHAAGVSRGQATILVGGTGLYIRALTSPLGLPEMPPNEEFREQWRTFAEENGQDALYAVLKEQDKATAARLHPNDTKRIIRALEVQQHTGKPLSYWHEEDRRAGRALLPDVQIFGLNRERESLRAIIDTRVDSMIAAGFLDEVESLRRAGYNPALNSMQSLGYKQINAHLDGTLTLREAIDEIKLRTKQFARRQLIWFRADPRIRWIDVEPMDSVKVAESILASVGKNH